MFGMQDGPRFRGRFGDHEDHDNVQQDGGHDPPRPEEPVHEDAGEHGLHRRLEDPALGGFETVRTLRDATSTEAKRALAATRDPAIFRTATGEFDAILNAPADLRCAVVGVLHEFWALQLVEDEFLRPRMCKRTAA